MREVLDNVARLTIGSGVTDPGSCHVASDCSKMRAKRWIPFVLLSTGWRLCYKYMSYGRRSTDEPTWRPDKKVSRVIRQGIDRALGTLYENGAWANLSTPLQYWTPVSRIIKT